MKIEERYLIAGIIKTIELPISLLLITIVLQTLGYSAFSHEYEFLSMWLGMQFFTHLIIKYLFVAKVINLKEMDSTLSIGKTFIWSGIGGVHMIMRYFWTKFKRTTDPSYREDFIRSYFDITFITH
jgi:hypothetical protein